MEYGRTDKGNIFIYANVLDENNNKLDYILVKEKSKHFANSYTLEKKWLKDEKIVKHSKNIIDLIEAGDYVNGHKVNNITNDEYEFYGDNDWVTKKDIHLECGDEEGCIIIESNNIKSIITKEQFKSIEYRLEE